LRISRLPFSGYFIENQKIFDRYKFVIKYLERIQQGLNELRNNVSLLKKNIFLC